MTRGSSDNAFTLVELMIVVAIIAIIMSVAIPSILNARKSANEASAIATLKALVTANEQYRTRYGTYVDPWALQDQDFIEGFTPHGAFPGKNGYTFLSAFSGNGYTVWSLPQSVGQTGDRYFTTSNRGTIHWSSTAPANINSDPVIGN
ncbi:MAG: prepilin-type N-terminal cleavage/methylation domain-containing protein [Planctomycetota bacterium]